MPVDKALNPAPSGLTDIMSVLDDAPELIVEIEGDEGANDEPEEQEDEFTENLADTILDEEQLRQISTELVKDYEEDILSRKDWMETYADGLELLGLKVEERSEPWEGACAVNHPLLAEAVVKFQAETMMETFPAQGPVKTQLIGEETPQKKEAADRVKEDMNYQLTERMVEYRPEHERMLWGLGLAGNAFKKVYFDPSLDRQVSIYVTAEDVVVPYGASNLETAERVTHVMRKTENELTKLQKSGFYRDIELPEPTNTLDDIEKKIAEQLGFSATSDDRYKLLEMQVELIIEDDKYRDDSDEDIALPYIVTIEKSSGEVLAIRRNWDPDDKKKVKRNHFVHYSYVPGFGFYAFGLIHLIGSFAKSGTSLIRQLVDAGTLANLPGGFKTKGLRVKGDDTPIGPGEFRDVDVASGAMRDNIMPLPYKEPSTVLYQLLQTIVDEGRRFASAGDMKVSDMSAQAPVGTTLAILERTLKIMSAIQARIHYAMRQEFRLLKGIIRDYTPDSYSYTPYKGPAQVKQEDYDIVEVIPVSDPNAATMAQKIVQYQAVIQLAQTAPQIYDMPYLHRQMLEVLGIKNAQKLVPMEDDEDKKPMDPVSENMAIINNKPVKAFIAQDHQAHIQVHISAQQDPKIQGLLQQNPQAPAMMAAMNAHIAEHLAYEYRKQIEEQAGVPLPAPDAQLSPDMEVAISRLQAAAAQQLLQKNQSEAAQQKAQEMMQDPIVQMQMKELEIKERDSKTKEQKVLVDAAATADKQKLEEEKLAAHERIEGLKVGAKIATDKANLSAKQQAEGLRVGVQIAQDLASKDVDSTEKARDRAHTVSENEKDRQERSKQAEKAVNNKGE